MNYSSLRISLDCAGLDVLYHCDRQLNFCAWSTGLPHYVWNVSVTGHGGNGAVDHFQHCVGSILCPRSSISALESVDCLSAVIGSGKWSRLCPKIIAIQHVS